MTGPAHTNTTTAADIIEAHQFTYDSDCGLDFGCSCDEDGTDDRLAWAAHVADELARAGLLADPTARTEWGVACDIHDEVSEAEDREDAERIKAHHDAGMDHGHTIVRRTVTDWTPAEEGE